MSSFLVRLLVGAGAGIVFGLAVYRFIGCRSGACPLTGNPWVAAVWWGVVGLVIAWGR